MEAYRGLRDPHHQPEGRAGYRLSAPACASSCTFRFRIAAQREAIWRSVFPARTPLDARSTTASSPGSHVTGGNIRNIAINAAFRAAELDEPVSMEHLLHAAHHEASKRERPLSDAETRGWV